MILIIEGPLTLQQLGIISSSVMGEVKTSLKRCLICINIILGVIGVISVIMAVVGQIEAQEYGELEIDTKRGIAFFYGLGFGVILLSCLGFYSVYKEKKWVLIIFLTLTVLGCILFLLFGLITVGAFMVMEVVLQKFADAVSLHNATIRVQKSAEALQSDMHCCGYINGYEDWGSEIPDSCLCPQNESDECEIVGESQRELTTTLPERHPYYGKSVYKEPCLPLLHNLVVIMFKVVLAIIFSLFTLMLLVTVLCAVMLHQMTTRRPAEGLVVFKH